MASNKNSQMQKYLELAEAINSSFPHFQTSPAELANLSANKKIDFFRVLLEEYHVNIEAVLKANLEKCSHPTAYQNTMYVFVIYAYTAALFQAICEQRLPLIDFLKSGSSRILNKIKVMVHFYGYTNNCLYHILKPVSDSILSDLQFLANKENHLSAVKVSSNEIAVEISSCEDILKKQEEETKICILKCTERIHAEEKLVEENKKLKQDLENLEVDKKRLSETLAQALDQEKKLSKLVVSDYELLMEKRDKIKTYLIELTSSRDELLQNNQVKLDCSTKYSKTIESMRKLTDIVPLITLLNNYKIIKSRTTAIKKTEQDYNNLLSYRDELLDEEKPLNTSCEKIDMEIQEYRVKQANFKANFTAEMEVLQKEHEEIIRKTKKCVNLSEEFQKQIQFAKACCNQHEDNYNVLTDFYKKQYKKILDSKTELDKTVDKGLKDLHKKAKSVNLKFTE